MQLNANYLVDWVYAFASGINGIHVALAAPFVILCIIIYRIGYGVAVSKMCDEIHSREEKLLEIEGQLLQREKILGENIVKLQIDTNRFEEERFRRIDDSVRALFDSKRAEFQIELDRERGGLQSEFDKKREELVGKYREAKGKLHDAEKLASSTEEQFREEYEKWVRRNRPPASDEPDIELSPEQMLAFSYITNTKRNLFIQGQAGTGKSTLIKFLKMHCTKKMIFASPTGAAAFIIGGSTIHSIFGIPPKDFIDLKKRYATEIHSATESLLRETELVIIDEASMVNPNILDVIDWTAKKARKNNLPFGGLQIVLVGDLFQLPPVIKNNVKDIFKQLYGYRNAYFFDALTFKEGNFSAITLNDVFRQNDSELLTNLDRILKQKHIGKALDYFNSAKITSMEYLDIATSLTPTNAAANKINKIRLLDIEGPLFAYHGIVGGKFDLKDAPARPELELKVGALVLFTNNHFSIRNGTSAIVKELDRDAIRVQLMDGGRGEIWVQRDIWENTEYKINRLTKEIEENIIGSYSQFPLQLGYAITIHRAQGKTLDKAIIDKARGHFFTHGHLYVALSRTRTKSDMHVAVPLTENDILLDGRVVEVFKNPELHGFNSLSVFKN